jgi:tetratricopeptide (TPR) repeat protein
MQAAARIGFSRLLTRYATVANSLAAADQAIQLTPDDPDAHRARATVLNRLHRSAEAEAALETATSLRQDHAVQWLELGATREELDDNEGALAAYDQAVRCAPYYAQTHWQRGNLLLRLGRYDEAFADLRQAAASNRKFLVNVIDLAWSLTKGDANQTAALLQVSNDTDRLEFARFLARKGKVKEVEQQVGLLAAPLSDENRRELTQLAFAAGSYGELYRLSPGTVKVGGIVNGSFEEPLVLNDSSFGWKVSPSPAKTTLTVDVSQKSDGQRSLHVSFEGDWDPSVSLLSQTIVVRAEQRYRLTFAVKTQDVVTGGPPRIVLRDVTNNQILAKSDAFPQTTNGWQQMNVDFSVPARSEAVAISLVRDNCSSSPCPIFGVMWLDDFQLQKL